jgi:hypothetical protein
MAFVTNYNFDNMSRIGNDACFQDQNTIQNVRSCNYTLENYFANDCTMKIPIQVATSQPGIMYNGTSIVGSGGCVVDQSSELLFGSKFTHPKSKIDLFHIYCFTKLRSANNIFSFNNKRPFINGRN